MSSSQPTGRTDMDCDLQISRCIDAGYPSCYIFPSNSFSVIHGLRRNQGVSNLADLGLTSSSHSYPQLNDHQARVKNTATNVHVPSGQIFTPLNSIQPNETFRQGYLDGIVEQINKLRISEDEGSAGEINRHLEQQTVGGQSTYYEKLDLGQHIMNNGVEIYADKLGSASAGLGFGNLQQDQPHASVAEGNWGDDRVADDLDWKPNFCSDLKQSGGRNFTYSHSHTLENLEENEFGETFQGTLTPTSSEGSDWDYPL
jgi:hypothetical protein